jgi:hypothetical protein
MTQSPANYKIRFLVSTKSWEQVKKVFKEDLGITKDKKDDSVVPIRDHFVVEIELSDNDLTDDFYEKVIKSKHITILSDEFSQENARRVLEAIAPIELKLRELAVYAYDLAATYKEIMNTKHKDAKLLLSNNRLVGENVADPLVSFLDFGELITFLDKTGNQVDESNFADDTARLMESSTSFDEFKKKFSAKFKKLTVWDIISDAVLASKAEWGALKKDLNRLRDIRNVALHHRALSLSLTAEAELIATKLLAQFKTKTPKKNSVENMDAVFESWNTALKSYNSNQKILSNLFTVDTSALQKVAERQLDSQQTLQKAIEALGGINRFPNIQTSAFESLSRSINSINKLGLSSWVTDDSGNGNSVSSAETSSDDTPEEESEDKNSENKKGDKK